MEAVNFGSFFFELFFGDKRNFTNKVYNFFFFQFCSVFLIVFNIV